MLKITLSIVLFFLLLSSSYAGEVKPAEKSPSAGDIEKANQLGEEFQRQMPWSRESPQSGEYYGSPQPKSYFSTPERELPESEPPMAQYPFCYNPYTRIYEYCYPPEYGYYNSQGYDYYYLRGYGYYYPGEYYYRFRLHLPEFRFYWEYGGD